MPQKLLLCKQTNTNMKILPILLFLSTTLSAQNFAGKYTGTYEGDPVVLTLTSTGGNTYSGDMNDGSNNYKISATAQGKTLKGTCTETTQNIALDMSGTLEGAKLAVRLNFTGVNLDFDVFKEEKSAAAKPQSAAPKDNKQRDPALVGRWTRQENYNSGYGQSGSMSSESSLVFLADGRVADGGSRTVVGGSDFSGSNSAEASGVVEGLIWYTDKQNLYLQVTENGKTETEMLGRYYIENNNMLVTGQDGTKVLFYRG